MGLAQPHAFTCKGLSVSSGLLNRKTGGYNTRHSGHPHQDHFPMSEVGADRKRQVQELSVFHDVAKALTSTLNLDSVLQTIMEKMAEYFQPDNWSLLMVDENTEELYFAIAVGDAADTLKSVRLKLGEGIAGWVAKHGEQLIVPDVASDIRFARRIDDLP